ncbi:MAG TPA: RcnB family protein [Terracidiphilus sp.]|nr:RcnB family protein [Terracidiphilus sp.]
MNRTCKALAVAAIAATFLSGTGYAQDHHDDQRDNHHYVKHEEWKKGYHMRHEDWDRGEHIDYRTYHLRRPPAGYEWRLIDGSYVLARTDTGIVASIVIAPR